MLAAIASPEVAGIGGVALGALAVLAGIVRMMFGFTAKIVDAQGKKIDDLVVLTASQQATIAQQQAVIAALTRAAS